jgi:hypothetical protein
MNIFWKSINKTNRTRRQPCSSSQVSRTSSTGINTSVYWLNSLGLCFLSVEWSAVPESIYLLIYFLKVQVFELTLARQAVNHLSHSPVLCSAYFLR